MKKTLLLVLLCVSLLCLFILPGRISHEKFDSEKWKHTDLNNENNLSLRWDMMNSLRNNYNLVGMKEVEIINLLGIPDDIEQFHSNYFLGFTGTGINTGSLRIYYDKNRIVKYISVWQG